MEYSDVEVTGFAAKGKAIAKVKDKVVFVNGGVPGDVVDIKVFKKRKKFLEAKIINLIKPSSLRIDSFCEHFGTCGGCKWQHLSYKDQLTFKENEVVENLKRIGKQNNFKTSSILSSEKEKYYRNKLEFTFSNKVWVEDKEQLDNPNLTHDVLGFHVPGRFDKVLKINKCHLQELLSNDIRNFIEAYGLKNNLSFYDLKEHKGFLRNLIIRNSTLNEWMVALMVGENDLDNIHSILTALKNEFPQITSIYYAINQKVNDSIYDLDMIHFAGKEYIEEKVGHYTFNIGPKSFFQVNIPQTQRLYQTVVDFAEFTKDDLVYDLYSGAGSISIFVSDYVKHVIGIEYVQDAVDAAFENSKKNKVKNTSFFAGDMHKVLTESFIQEHGSPNIIITDPPRAGMHQKVVEAMLKMEPQKIIYVSCNSATQARDIELLSSKYTLVKIQPVDMFPHTHHVENVGLLVRC